MSTIVVIRLCPVYGIAGSSRFGPFASRIWLDCWPMPPKRRRTRPLRAVGPKTFASEESVWLIAKDAGAPKCPGQSHPAYLSIGDGQIEEPWVPPRSRPTMFCETCALAAYFVRSWQDDENFTRHTRRGFGREWEKTAVRLKVAWEQSRAVLAAGTCRNGLGGVQLDHRKGLLQGLPAWWLRSRHGPFQFLGPHNHPSGHRYLYDPDLPRSNSIAGGGHASVTQIRGSLSLGF
jgi:hypothetical protein